MKQVGYLAVLIIFLVMGISIFMGLKAGFSSAPKFQSAHAAPTSLGDIEYDFLNPRPFEAGKMWVYGPPNGTNRHTGVFIYDIEKRQVLGTVINCWPAMLFGEPLKLVCFQPTQTSNNRLRQWLANFLARISWGRIKIPPAVAGQTYWLVALNKNAAKRLGDVPGTPNTMIPSPDYHYCFTMRLGQTGPEDYLLDLRKGLTQRLELPASGWAYDWWDKTRLLLKTTNTDFVLYDVTPKTISPLIAFEKLAALLKDSKLSDNPKQTQAFTIWNGRENDFYLTDTQQKWAAGESFLIKVERPDGKLRLLSPHFKFEWSDHLDRTGRYYLYTGRDSGNNSDGVFLRDLETSSTQVLVAPTTNHYFSIPRFNGDSIIYIRSNALWQIDANGSNNVKLFPPQ